MKENKDYKSNTNSLSSVLSASCQDGCNSDEDVKSIQVYWDRTEIENRFNGKKNA